MLRLLRVTRSSLLRYSVGLLTIAASLLFLWPGLAGNLFASGFGVERFMPHGHCYLWIPSLVALHISSDFLIGISYTAISLTLAYLVHRARRDIPFHWIFLAFGLFIVACGATHFMEVWTLWNATYWLSGYVKLVTAAASVATAVVLPGVVPKTLFLVREAKSSDERKQELETANRRLEEELARRRQAEEALQETNQLLEAIIQASPLAVYALDARGNVKMWNSAAERIFGWGEDETTGQPLPFVSEDHQRKCCALRERVMHGHVITDVEGLHHKKDGTQIEVSISAAPLRDAGGDITGIMAVTADITERNRAEEALRESEEQYRELVESANDIIYSFDLTGRFTSLNRAGELITGYTREEALTMSLEDVVAPDHLEPIRQRLAATVAGRMLLVYELEIVAKGGNRVLLEINSRPIIQNGVVVGVQGIARDITERKRIEAERDAERRLLDALIAHLPVGVIFRDVQGNYTRANQKACDIFGVTCDELTGMTADDLATRVKVTRPGGASLTDAEYPTSLALRTQGPTEPVELLITTPAGDMRRIVSHAASVTNDKGEPFGVVVVVSDVTEQHALQDRFRQSQKMESIGVLAGGVAHDFNNLLTVILGNTQLAFRGVEPGTPLQQRLLEIEKAGNRATALTRQLLAFGRRQRLERKTLNLNDTINEIMKMLRRVIGEDIEVRVQESAHLHSVFADPAQIEQVVMNIAVNARDAMPRGGRLIIETRNVTFDEAYRRKHPYAKPGKYVEVRISDTGTGMDEETLKRIFEPFFTTKEQGKGTGLGLSMVFGIIKQHGGLCEVYSEVGYGTTFKIYLPVDEKEVAEEAQEILPPLWGGTETILIAEDEEALRLLARNILEELGYTVLLAKDGEEAVEVYKANRDEISLLLFDIVMPRVGGREAFEQISELGDEVPVIFMTGYSAEIVQYEFVKQHKFIEEAGALLMQKPYSVETLGRKVREVLDAAGKA